jgi:hypothetical protein
VRSGLGKAKDYRKGRKVNRKGRKENQLRIPFWVFGCLFATLAVYFASFAVKSSSGLLKLTA